MTRTQALMLVLGWQGGTVHQVAEETGLTETDIVHCETHTMSTMGMGSDYNKGWFAARNNSLEFNRSVVFPKYKGNLAFWMGAADGKMFNVNA